jgi:hypothetical protein
LADADEFKAERRRLKATFREAILGKTFFKAAD